jgi:glyoxylase-like metal-dependent hydrolase (beta-lactamase superfamily II)
MKLAANLHRVGSDLVNSYLVADDAGVTVIDTGMPGDFDALVAELRAMGRTVDDIRGVLLTHGDTDHIGFAERLRRDHGVPIHVGEADAARARGEEKKPGVPLGPWNVGPFLRFLWYGLRRGGLRPPPVGEVVPLRGGETLDLPGQPRVIPMPGHSPGSLAYHVPAVDAVFVGDAMTTGHVLTGATGPQPAPFTQDQPRAAESFAALASLEARWVLPGHGAPWDAGVAEAIRRYEAAGSGTGDARTSA